MQTVLLTRGGVGHHVEFWDIYNPVMIDNWSRTLLAVELTYFLAVCTGKLAILTIYTRNFPSRPMLDITYTLMGIVVATWFGTSMAAIFQSVPVGCQWDQSATSCKSIDMLSFFRYCSLPNIITDILVLFLPMPKIWRLRLSRSDKFGLTAVFLTGSM